LVLTVLQNGASAHYSQDVQIFLNEQYLNHWIGREGLVLWPPKLLEFTLNRLDYHLWEYVKDTAYQEASIMRLDMTNRIRRVK